MYTKPWRVAELVAVLLLAGCSSEPWRTPPCEGQFEPINVSIAPESAEKAKSAHGSGP